MRHQMLLTRNLSRVRECAPDEVLQTRYLGRDARHGRLYFFAWNLTMDFFPGSRVHIPQSAIKLPLELSEAHALHLAGLEA